MKTVLGIAAFFAVVIFGSWGCREAQINSCEDRGGQALTAEWYNGNWTDVRCVEPNDTDR